MRRTAIYPGSFDPITFGHIDLIERLLPLYDQLTVVVAQSSSKNSLFTSEERMALIKTCLPQVDVQIHNGLTIDFAKSIGAQVILRGLRAMSDFEYESAVAAANKKLEPTIETLITFTRPEYGYISSRMVKEIASFGGDLKTLVPPPVAQALHKKINKG